MLLYPYTDLNSLLGIIQSDYLEFWGSRHDCMNDPLDFQFAKNRIYPTMMEVAKTMNYQETETMEVDTDPYIVSFSKKKDDFLMWRLYNAQVALILDRRYFERPTPNSALIDCEYVDDSDSPYREEFLRIDDCISYCRNVSANTSRICTFIKHKSFECEGEVRLASWDYHTKEGNFVLFPDCVNDDETVENSICTRTNKYGKVVLYKKFHIDKNALVGIIVHTYSTLDFSAIHHKLRSILINKGYSREVFENITPTDSYPITPLTL